MSDFLILLSSFLAQNGLKYAIWVFLCQLLPLCHLVKAPNPWCGEQGFWWLTWRLCVVLVGSSAHLSLDPHTLS